MVTAITAIMANDITAAITSITITTITVITAITVSGFTPTVVMASTTAIMTAIITATARAHAVGCIAMLWQPAAHIGGTVTTTASATIDTFTSSWCAAKTAFVHLPSELP